MNLKEREIEDDVIFRWGSKADPVASSCSFADDSALRRREGGFMN